MLSSQWTGIVLRMARVRPLGPNASGCISKTRLCLAATECGDGCSEPSAGRFRRQQYPRYFSSSGAGVKPSNTGKGTNLIRLTKRMGELDMFSRREADRLIQDGRVLLDGEVVEVGHKVPPDLQADRIFVVDEGGSSAGHTNQRHTTGDVVTAVVLNKPLGYVSGQAEHGNPPAIRLLTKRNRAWGKHDDYDSDCGSDTRHWKGFAPAGRLDRLSTGLLVFTSNGVLAKKLIGAASTIEKEYIVDLEPALRPTKMERSIDPSYVPPPPTLDLAELRKGGRFLLGDEHRPLKPCPQVEWIGGAEGENETRQLRIVLTEGRKHHVRRVCRELLGQHVVGLRRVRIGPIELVPDDGAAGGESLPVGCWRPLREEELEALLRRHG